MASQSSQRNQQPGNWFCVANQDQLAQGEKIVVRPDGKQIALFHSPGGIRACDNRCPHEGYPLAEGSLDEDCILTCNWHNWKFNLESGENLYGGDKLRTYPVEVENGEIWIDLTEPPYEERYEAISRNLKDAFGDNAYDRIAREIARLTRLGADPLDALRMAISWSFEKMEFGFTHAYAGMADWLSLYAEFSNDEEIQLACLLEPVSHTAFDVLREKDFPYSENVAEYDEAEFVEAIEREDEDTAVAMIRGGIAGGMGFEDFDKGLTIAALNHYSDFGHSLIYITKAADLVSVLGEQILEPVLLPLARSLVFATREDRIPEFRVYESALQNWGKNGDTPPSEALWHKKGIKSALDATLCCSQQAPMEIYSALLTACAVSMLSYDIDQQSRVHVTVSGNVSWLDFTHALTFGSAVHTQCQRYPELWPNGLLQMACFTGRNAAFTTDTYDIESWGASSVADGISGLVQKVLDHGQDEHIVSVHWLKTLLAVREEIKDLNPQQGQILFAAVNRYINSPLRRRQTRRTAYQSIKFVEKE